MKIKILIINLFIVFFIPLLSSCKKNVTITFLQKPVVDIICMYGDDESYIFGNEVIATTVLEYEKNYYLSDEEIEELKRLKNISYEYQMAGDGLIYVTSFMSSSNGEGLYFNPLKQG